MIIGFAGRKRSGKDSALKYVYGQVLVKNEVVDKFDMTPDGDLLLPAQFADGEIKMGVFDIARRDFGMVNYLSQEVWPYVKDYYFGAFLKEMILKMYNIKFEQLNGTTEQKQSEIPYTWEPFLDILPKSVKPKGKKKTDKMIAREFIQRYADLLRHIDPMALIKVLVDEINFEQPPLALVGDVRFINEVNAIKDMGGKVIFLKRKIDDDTHKSESELDSLEESYFDAVLDNTDLTLEAKNVELHRIMSEWGVF